MCAPSGASAKAGIPPLFLHSDHEIINRGTPASSSVYAAPCAQKMVPDVRGRAALHCVVVCNAAEPTNQLYLSCCSAGCWTGMVLGCFPCHAPSVALHPPQPAYCKLQADLVIVEFTLNDNQTAAWNSPERLAYGARRLSVRACCRCSLHSGTLHGIRSTALSRDQLF